MTRSSYRANDPDYYEDPPDDTDHWEDDMPDHWWGDSAEECHECGGTGSVFADEYDDQGAQPGPCPACGGVGLERREASHGE